MKSPSNKKKKYRFPHNHRHELIRIAKLSTKFSYFLDYVVYFPLTPITSSINDQFFGKNRSDISFANFRFIIST